MTSLEKMTEIVEEYVIGYKITEMINRLHKEGFIRREKAKLVAPTYIQGRKFDKVFHCTACNGIPYGGVGEDSHFCTVCGAEIEEIVENE